VIFDWLLDLVPLWVWAIGAVAVAFGAWRVLGTRGLLGAIAGLAAFLAYRTGRQTGGADAVAKQKAKEQKARDIADEVDSDVGAMPPADARDELGKWGR
jgi:hypothetical protein